MKKEELHYIHSFEEYLNDFIDLLISYSPKVISALIILIVGLYAIRLINRTAVKIMQKREMEVTLSEFLSNSLLWAMRVLLFITVISRLGIESSSFVAILGAAGLAVGLSLQGSLSNLAGGVLIILFKPFKVGDSIEAQGVNGVVTDIEIFSTKLLGINNQTIYIPNGILSNGTIINHSQQGFKRAEIVFSLSYETNIKNAKDILMEVMKNNKKVLKKPEPLVVVKNLADTSILLAIKPCAKIEDFLAMTSDIMEESKEAFDNAGIAFHPSAVKK
ncbi:mechanosensitive ion channel protein [Flavobacterium lutivivi]|nr:mechanosensitive ion channel protein [Flavobacterium lutivivi]